MDEIKASPTKPGQEFLGRLGQVAERLGIKLEEAMKIVNQEGNSPVKSFLVNMMVSEPLKSAGTALQDWTGTPRDATEDYPYRRMVTGKGMTASLDPRILDVAPIAGTAASRVAHGIKHLPTDVMRAAVAAYGPRATASPMDVWHGSPHRFPPTAKNPLGEFDPTKIGTGEGAQAYGYGLYFAENPKVAQTYIPPSESGVSALQKALSDESKRAARYGNEGAQEVFEMFSKGYTPQGIRANIDNILANETVHPAYAKKMEKAYEKGMEIIKQNKGGSLYKVDIPDEQIAKMLDWDKPLSEQAPEVQAALSNAGINVLSKPKASMIKNYDVRDIVREALKVDKPENVALVVDNDRNLYEKAIRSAKKKGIDIDESAVGDFVEKEAADYLKALSDFYGQTGERVYKGLMQNPNSMVEASETLRGFGIPGIKYFDAASRDVGEGTRNFVVFPGGEEMLTIKERMKDGGKVKKPVSIDAMRLAVGGMASIPQKAMRAFVEAGKKAKLAEQAKEAVNKGELFIPPEDVNRMQRELLQGIKKPEELAEGGQITADQLILEERPL